MGRVDRLIKAKLDANVKVSLTDMRQWQANSQPLDAELLRPALLTAFDNAGATGAWSQLAALRADPAVAEAVGRIRNWDLSTPTGIREGYDPGDNPANLPEPSAAEVSNSVAATLYTFWRNQTVRNVIDATLTRVGLSSQLPGNEETLRAIKNLLDTFPTARGKDASGLDFFVVSGAPNPEAARDFLLLKSLKDGLTLLASQKRMLDYQRLGEAVCMALGGKAGEFSQRLDSMHGDSLARGLESYGVAVGIQILAARPRGARVGRHLPAATERAKQNARD